MTCTHGHRSYVTPSDAVNSYPHSNEPSTSPQMDLMPHVTVFLADAPSETRLQSIRLVRNTGSVSRNSLGNPAYCPLGFLTSLIGDVRMTHARAKPRIGFSYDFAPDEEEENADRDCGRYATGGW
ncbi:hypothetical protein RhiJN_18414 [Ceratobasidium sp. AG-Ba]|nr:hypothetical protein RhiJN_18414 [Ceratobasidium sp. AG-Ba]